MCSFSACFAAKWIAPITAAAPAISLFIVSIPPGVGFRLRPPVSYTTPFPISTIGFLFLCPFGLYSAIVKVGGSIEPLFTERSPPIFNASIFAFSNISTLILLGVNSVLISLANCSAVK